MKIVNLKFRPATPDDAEALSSLLDVLFTQEADFTPNTQRQVRALRLITSEPHTGQIVCAVQDDQIVGMVSILFTVSTAEGGRAALLEDMVVRPDKRRQSIGEQLLKEASCEGRSNGIRCPLPLTITKFEFRILGMISFLC